MARRSLVWLCVALTVGLAWLASPDVGNTRDAPLDEVWEHLKKRGFDTPVGKVAIGFNPFAGSFLIARSPAICDDDLVRVPELRHVDYLELSNTKVTDAGVKTIAGMKLRVLSLDKTKVGDASIPVLAQMRLLTSLDLGDTQVTAAGLRPLLKLPALASLSLDGLKVGDETVAELRALPLGGLSLARTAITDGAAKHLRAFPKLGGLNVSDTNTGDEIAKVAAGFEGLEGFSCAGTAVGDDGFAAFRNHRGITSITADRTRITDKSLAVCGSMVNLNYLRLAGCRITTASLASLAGCEALSLLDISSTAVDGNPIEVLAPLKGRLVALYMNDLKLDPQAYKQLPRLGGLFHLSLDRSPVTNAEVRGLWTMECLRDLSLAGCDKITDAAFAGVDKAAVTQLNLAKTGVGDLTVARLAEVQLVFELNLSGTRITDRAFADLAKMPLLRRVNVTGTAVGADAVAAFKKLKPDVEVVGK